MQVRPAPFAQIFGARRQGPAPSPVTGMLAPLAIALALALRRSARPPAPPPEIAGASQAPERPDALPQIPDRPVHPAPGLPAGRPGHVVVQQLPAGPQAPGGQSASAFWSDIPVSSGTPARSSIPAGHGGAALPPGLPAPTVAGGEDAPACPGISALAESLLGRQVRVAIAGQHKPITGVVAAITGELLVLCHDDRVIWIDLCTVIAIRVRGGHRRRHRRRDDCDCDGDGDGDWEGPFPEDEEDSWHREPDDGDECEEEAGVCETAGEAEVLDEPADPADSIQADWDLDSIQAALDGAGDETPMADFLEAVSALMPQGGEGAVPDTPAPDTPAPAASDRAIPDPSRREPVLRARVIVPQRWCLVSTWRPRCA